MQDFVVCFFYKTLDTFIFGVNKEKEDRYLNWLPLNSAQLSSVPAGHGHLRALSILETG